MPVSRKAMSRRGSFLQVNLGVKTKETPTSLSLPVPATSRYPPLSQLLPSPAEHLRERAYEFVAWRAIVVETLDLDPIGLGLLMHSVEPAFYVAARLATFTQ
jgi:hypothetical protein